MYRNIKDKRKQSLCASALAKALNGIVTKNTHPDYTIQIPNCKSLIFLHHLGKIM